MSKKLFTPLIHRRYSQTLYLKLDYQLTIQQMNELRKYLLKRFTLFGLYSFSSPDGIIDAKSQQLAALHNIYTRNKTSISFEGSNTFKQLIINFFICISYPFNQSKSQQFNKKIIKEHIQQTIECSCFWLENKLISSQAFLSQKEIQQLKITLLNEMPITKTKMISVQVPVLVTVKHKQKHLAKQIFFQIKEQLSYSLIEMIKNKSIKRCLIRGPAGLFLHSFTTQDQVNKEEEKMKAFFSKKARTKNRGSVVGLGIMLVLVIAIYVYVFTYLR